MPEANVQSLLRRKAKVQQSGFAPGARTAARVWQTTMPRVADKMLGLHLRVEEVSDSNVLPSQLLARADESSLIALIQTADGREGVAVLESGLLAGLIEAVVCGEVGRGELMDRPATETDGAICAPIVDGWIRAFDSEVAPFEEQPAVATARILSRLQDPRSAVLALPEMTLSATRISLDIGEGARSGVLTLAVASTAADSGESLADELTEDLQANVAGSAVYLDAVLHRFQMPLNKIEGTEVGDIVTLPVGAIRNVSLEGLDGRRVAIARLGQIGGAKAVCLNLQTGTSHSEDTGALATEERLTFADAIHSAARDDEPDERPKNVSATSDQSELEAKLSTTRLDEAAPDALTSGSEND